MSIERLINSTDKDPVLKKLREFIRKGYLPKGNEKMKPLLKNL
jgi:hypothetical protein